MGRVAAGDGQRAHKYAFTCCSGESIFEYGINPETMEWERWATPAYKPPKGDVEDWSGVLVPTLRPLDVATS